MFEIKGKVNTALCYAKVVEEEAIEQIRRMCEYLEYEVEWIKLDNLSRTSCSNLRLFPRKANNVFDASSAIVYSSIMEFRIFFSIVSL